jgi:hypothetical protein
MSRAARWCVAAIALGVLGAGCVTTPESLMKLSRASAQGEADKAAARLVEVAASRDYDVARRAWALRALGALGRAPLPTLHRLGALATGPATPPEVRAWAAFALGELRRKEALPYLLQLLADPSDAATCELALDGLCKSIAVILEDPALQSSTTAAMSSYAARATTGLSDVFYVLHERTDTLAASAGLIERLLDEPSLAAPASGQLYAAVLDVLRGLEVGKEQWLAGYDRNEATLRRSIEVVQQAADRGERALALLVAWNAGLLGDRPELAQLWTDAASRFVRDADPARRLLALWALSRLSVYQPSARLALLEALRVEQDERLLRLAGSLSSGAATPDLLQRLVGVRAPGGAP